jgi:hypothetical protein
VYGPVAGVQVARIEELETADRVRVVVIIGAAGVVMDFVSFRMLLIKILTV